MHTKNLVTKELPVPEQVYLTLVLGRQRRTWTIEDFATIGRAPTNTVVLEDAFLSQRHARMEKRSKGYFIRDLNSSNGVKVNGTQVTEAQLNDGDRIHLGPLEFSFSHLKNEETFALSPTSKNEAFYQQLQRLPDIASSELPVLLQGPSGAGKEVIAQCIHQNSKRSRGAFVSINCSALSENLIESELFGHIRGSFTGAENSRQGAFEAARGGTLFLDEIGDLPLALQPKLLRALEAEEIKPVGSDQTKKTNIRLITATHKDLIHKIRIGEFREDLYYRIFVIPFRLPALNHRMQDFEDLLYYFGKKYKVSFSVSSIEELKKHSWPGNIRELKNFVARASAIVGRRDVEVDDLESLIELDFKAESLGSEKKKKLSTIKSIERQMIIDSLAQFQGNQRRAAKHLKMPKSTLHDRIKTYGIDLESFKPKL